jgi:hypothetical protein
MVGESTSIDENQYAALRIFPNPAENNLHIESDKIIERIEVMNLMGSPLLKRNDFGDYTTTIDISGLKPGFYLVRIYCSTGEVLTQRVLKK